MCGAGGILGFMVRGVEARGLETTKGKNKCFGFCFCHRHGQRKKNEPRGQYNVHVRAKRTSCLHKRLLPCLCGMAADTRRTHHEQRRFFLNCFVFLCGARSDQHNGNEPHRLCNANVGSKGTSRLQQKTVANATWHGLNVNSIVLLERFLLPESSAPSSRIRAPRGQSKDDRSRVSSGHKVRESDEVARK